MKRIIEDLIGYTIVLSAAGFIYWVCFSPSFYNFIMSLGA